MLTAFQRAIRPFKTAVCWPPIENELSGYTQYFTGNVLNAGAGDRNISGLVSGKLFNQDIESGLHNGKIDILSPLHRIPVEEGFFNAVICNAVLEHVRNPHEVLQEFNRVLAKNGILYLAVPFMQPEHLDPTDFQRYTRDGLQELVRQHGFEVVSVSGLHSPFHTLAWIVEKWLKSRKTVLSKILQLVLFPCLYLASKYSRSYVDEIASAYRVIARK